MFAAARLAEGGGAAAADLGDVWQGLEPLLLDADLENQEAAVAAAGEVIHLLAAASGADAAAEALSSGIARLCSVPEAVLREEGACQALALAVRVLAGREGSPLGVDQLAPFLVPTFLNLVKHDSHDVREVAAAALPPLLRRLGPARRAAFVPSALEALAGDSHWNVRAAAAPLLLRVVSQIDDLTEEERACTRAPDGVCAGIYWAN
ncbi:hypothetical protein MNEG_3787 [Monoraphidium neglectum]|uniref:Uncharacterized protein n=1 Tax=Monoraphidium neglectum TaxID=145388 RepID=A0A0D2LBT0_9CHLO|nr:hypothetical protein MNEG_3787 [Monoraphidium neglectum]KIZ04169.1 hypothetical protein MNEG_3787 [Monoraphidium neglectum]|eukprot:XP_013903188.1 hypothetical protein MNEG_3787 [Monoraphidium neglectum]